MKLKETAKTDYYVAFKEYDSGRNTKPMERIVALALIESLQKRIAFLAGDEIIDLSEWVRQNGLSAPAVFNAARRQTIPAFRERGIWKIGKDYENK